MADITASMVKELRERTGVGMMDCKKALKEVGGDIDEAIKHLRKQGAAKAEKKSGRATGDGRIAHYIHAGDKIGVMVELQCETDFVARTDDFIRLGEDIAMHVAASAPRFLSRDDVDEKALADEREVQMERVVKEGKPENVAEKIVEGRMGKFYQENCLLEQPFIKNPDVTIEKLVQEMIAKLGENIQLRRFARLAVGED
ncbi:MAG: translation elongation factor Ts [Acidobacteriota bacterium]